MQPGEYLAGFISMGTIREAPPQARETLSQDVWSCWQGDLLPGAAGEASTDGDQSIRPSERVRGS
ncbi:hypothetical protein GmRootV118_40380 [Variovorax sp. V118]|uniref:hypothetical protein n=1 Tax=Variovorax sp. V118 TaxID=3065954 RepID=UPI0034E8F7D4